MTAPAAIILAALAATDPGAGVEVRLAQVGPHLHGLMPCRIEVRDPNAALAGVAESLRIRPARGGPTLAEAVSIPPGSALTLDARPLPVLAPEQAFEVVLLDDAGRALLRRTVALETPDIEAVQQARGRLIDPPAYDGWMGALPRWPLWAKRNVLLASVLFALAPAAGLLIRAPGIRLGAVAVLAAMSLWPMLAVSQAPRTVTARQDGDTLAVASRRTAEWSHPGGTGPAPRIAPVYYSIRQFEADTLVYTPRGEVAVTLRPEAIRLFRLAGDAP